MTGTALFRVTEAIAVTTDTTEIIQKKMSMELFDKIYFFDGEYGL